MKYRIDRDYKGWFYVEMWQEEVKMNWLQRLFGCKDKEAEWVVVKDRLTCLKYAKSHMEYLKNPWDGSL